MALDKDMWDQIFGFVIGASPFWEYVSLHGIQVIRPFRQSGITTVMLYQFAL